MTSFRNTLPEGHLLDAWRIDRVVAASATAVVYAATDVQLGTPVAIKEYLPVRVARREEGGRVVPVDAAAFERGLQAFIASARMLARCQQPALVPVLQVSQANGTAYQVMPWIAATSLRDLRAAMPGPPDETALRALLDSLLSALAAVHATGSVHGGVDPAKILLQRDDQAVLLGPGSAARDAELTEAGGYVAPEQSGHGSDVPGPWTDLYALAAVMRFCIVGAPPSAAAAAPVGDDGPAMPADLPPARYSATLLAVIEQALSPQASSRPQSVAEFRAALAGRPPEPAVAAGPGLEVERARIRRVVDSINFGDDEPSLADLPLADLPLADPPLADPPPRRSAPRSARPPPTSPSQTGAAPAPRASSGAWRVAVLVGIAVLAAIGLWAALGLPATSDAPLAAASPAPVPASAPASAAKPSVEDSLAVAAAVLAAASDAPLAAASAPPDFAASSLGAGETFVDAPRETAASAPSLAIAANEAVPTAPIARAASKAAASSPRAAKPAPVKRAAAATATPKPAANPRTACSGRSDFALYRCMKTQCAQARWTAHPQCARLRQTDRVDG